MPEDPPKKPLTASPEQADLAAFLTGWFRAWQAGRLYGPGHPVVREAATQAAKAVEGLRQPRLVVVLPEGFECDGFAITSNTAAEALKALSVAMHGMDVGSIELTPGLTPDDTEASALALAHASDQPVVERVNAATPGRLSLRAVTYRGVHTRDAAHAPLPGTQTGAFTGPQATSATRARLWSQLNTGILNPDAQPADPGLLAQQIGDEMAADPQAAMSGLRDSLVGTARALANCPQDQQRQGMERMHTLLNGLGPQLRRSLERVAASHPQSAQTAGTASRDAMSTEILGAMSRGETAGAELSSEAMLLCQKLADLRPDTPPHADDDDQDPADDPADDANPAQAMAQAIESLFSRFDATEFTPEDYQSQIRGTLHAAAPAQPRPGLDRAFAADTLGVRCAHIASDLLDTDDSAPSPALQEVIAASVIPLIDAGEFAVLSARLSCGDATLIQTLARDVVIDRVLAADAQEHSGQDHAVITGLLNYAGDRVIDRATRRIIGGPIDHGDAPPLGPATQAALDSASAPNRHAALHRALADATGPLPHAAAPLLAGLPFNAATELLKTRLNAAELPERHAAYALLAAAFAQWPPRFLSQALRDNDPGVRRYVLDRLSSGNDARHLALAKITLGGQSPAGVLRTEAFDQLAQGTLARGIEGQWVAAQVLRILASALSPRRAALGARLAQTLTPYLHNPPVRRALLLWRFMPARWLAPLAGPRAAVAVAPAPSTPAIPAPRSPASSSAASSASASAERTAA